MSSDPDDLPRASQGATGRTPPGAQGASRGGVQPDDAPDESGRRSSFDSDAAYDRGRSSSGAGGGAPFGGYPFTGSQPRGGSGGWRSYLGGDAKFMGLPVGLIYALGAALIAIVFVGTVCGSPTRTGSVAGQVMQLSADRSVSALPGAQLTLRGGGNTYSTTSSAVDPNAEGEAAYNYRFENVPPGSYALEVQAPAGANLQPEDGLNLEVKSGQLFPQSVMLLEEGVQKPRQLAQNELGPGEAGGYVDDKGQRHTYQQGGGFDASDALLMYLLWRNPPGWGYGAPPVIVNSPGSSNYRVSNPPTQTRSGQTVTQRPTTPGQGATRPSSGSGATGSAPGRTSSQPDAVAPSTGTGSSSSGSNTGSGSSTQTQPSSSGSGSTVTQPRAPSQGTTRPSSSSSSPSRSSAPSRSSGSSGGGRR
ncbi:MAG TPA: carboxypeptidase-like regulatory domain-containing protein [Chloroflexota bacterium]|nr:carboxypeptidase-like regulatory domain-containing protein [Chloroflexota bacterium]